MVKFLRGLNFVLGASSPARPNRNNKKTKKGSRQPASGPFAVIGGCLYFFRGRDRLVKLIRKVLKFVAMRAILKSTKDMICKRVRVLGRSFSSYRARRMLKKSFACKFRLGGSVLCGTRSKIKTFTTAKLLLSDQWSLKGLFRSFGTTRSQTLPRHIDYCYKNNRHGPKHRSKIFSFTC